MGNFVDVDGKKIYCEVQGEGNFTVVLDAGLGMSSLSWHWIKDVLVSRTRVVCFDRPGLGYSPPDKGPSWLRRVDSIVDLTYQLLGKLKLQENLILVGHSSSGMHVRLYAHLYREQVKGIVLIDAAHEKQLQKLQGNSIYNSYPSREMTEHKMYLISGPEFSRLCWQFPLFVYVLKFFDMLGRSVASDAASMLAMISEHGSQKDSMEYMQTLDIMKPGQLGNMPLMIVSRDPQRGAGGRLYPNAKGDPEFQLEQAALSSNSSRKVVEGAGHGSLLFVKEDAEETAKAILQLVDAARNGSQLR
ncbi:hypothetical protein GUITHDRAFT_112268 [Guillardia theta CCMP2712]|uniref:AB hydrolase-1 domain-containing protein n=1 Tax=Guillardia theta (strain CCMP2712) TaxID=905079 RepID=L1J0D6_GUITC|nr:hypothetical protein GUITHDRAFT_112268 [Guillardia theta CCMP2712]EKX41555.1 hypothetical protein GUITHDRAFT_112268 [Guillardia theta CCMP2712]|eukprot:XP_005828535.1 hypothetical protein GUITHDRAFT_112268 [Guillardia theta CCMP2712]